MIVGMRAIVQERYGGPEVLGCATWRSGHPRGRGAGACPRRLRAPGRLARHARSPAVVRVGGRGGRATGSRAPTSPASSRRPAATSGFRRATRCSARRSAAPVAQRRGVRRVRAAPGARLAAKPAGLSFERPRSSPPRADRAPEPWSARATVQPGNGCSSTARRGGVGLFAVQIAKALGAEVTGVDAAAKLDAGRARSPTTRRLRPRGLHRASATTSSSTSPATARSPSAGARSRRRDVRSRRPRRLRRRARPLARQPARAC